MAAPSSLSFHGARQQAAAMPKLRRQMCPHAAMCTERHLCRPPRGKVACPPACWRRASCLVSRSHRGVAATSSWHRAAPDLPHGLRRPPARRRVSLSRQPRPHRVPAPPTPMPTRPSRALLRERKTIVAWARQSVRAHQRARPPVRSGFAPHRLGWGLRTRRAARQRWAIRAGAGWTACRGRSTRAEQARLVHTAPTI